MMIKDIEREFIRLVEAAKKLEKNKWTRKAESLEMYIYIVCMYS